MSKPMLTPAQRAWLYENKADLARRFYGYVMSDIGPTLLAEKLAYGSLAEMLRRQGFEWWDAVPLPMKHEIIDVLLVGVFSTLNDHGVEGLEARP